MIMLLIMTTWAGALLADGNLDYKGWHLVNFGKSQTPEQVFASHSEIESIWGWQGQAWAVAYQDNELFPPQGIQNLDAIVPELGYWIRINKPITLETPDITGLASLRDYPLSTEAVWHLLGAPESLQVIDFAESDLPSTGMVWVFRNNQWHVYSQGDEGSQNQYNEQFGTQFQNLRTIQSQEGFWVYFNADDTTSTTTTTTSSTTSSTTSTSTTSTTSSTTTTLGNFNNGRSRYNLMCAPCHGSQGKGIGENPSLIQCANCGNFATLRTYIVNNEPNGFADQCVGDCARDTAWYITQAFQDLTTTTSTTSTTTTTSSTSTTSTSTTTTTNPGDTTTTSTTSSTTTTTTLPGDTTTTSTTSTTSTTTTTSSTTTSSTTSTTTTTLPDTTPFASITAPLNNQTINVGDSVTFTASVALGNGTLTYLWDFDGGATNLTQKDIGAVTFNIQGTFTVKFSATDEDGDVASATVKITVNDPLETLQEEAVFINCSFDSNPLLSNPPELGAPLAVTNLQSDLDGDQLNLSWQDRSQADGFLILTCLRAETGQGDDDFDYVPTLSNETGAIVNQTSTTLTVSNPMAIVVVPYRDLNLGDGTKRVVGPVEQRVVVNSSISAEFDVLQSP